MYHAHILSGEAASNANRLADGGPPAVRITAPAELPAGLRFQVRLRALALAGTPISFDEPDDTGPHPELAAGDSCVVSAAGVDLLIVASGPVPDLVTFTVLHE
jgi:hypothetical protein